MRIISKFHDYYDIGMAYKQDEEVVWIRKEEEIKTNINRFGIDRHWFLRYELNAKSYRCYVKESYIALCGKLYSIHIGNVTGGNGGLGTNHLSAISYEDMKDRFAKLTKSIVVNKYAPHYGWGKTEVNDRNAWLNTPCHELHTKFDCPLLLINEESITKCPNLRNLGFQRVKDPYTTFQEIDMYISGVMGQKQNPMITISDKSKILKHGFDLKLSFRCGKK